MEFELTAAQCFADILFQAVPRSGFSIKVRIEEAEAIPAFCLHLIHRKIGKFQEVRNIGSIIRRERDADAGSDFDLMTTYFVKCADRFKQPERQDAGADFGIDVTPLKNRKLISSQTGNDVDIPGVGFESPGDFLE